MRLIQANQYLSQFQLNINYCFNKDNIPTDELSRIKRTETRTDIFTVSSNIIPVQNCPNGVYSTIQMFTGFAQHWAEVLKNDRHYRIIYANLWDKLSNQFHVESYGWIMKVVQGHLLLFVQKGSDGLQVCILNDLAKEVLKAAHNKDHFSIQNIFFWICDHFYMLNLSAMIQSYIGTCPEYAHKHTARHKPYGTL